MGTELNWACLLYTSRVFPMMNIRFVAITDNYDSSKKDADLMVAVTNIANDPVSYTHLNCS